MKVFRGFIYWVDFDPTQGAEMSKVRPAVVVSDNFMNEFGKTVVVCPVTSTLHPKWKSRIQSNALTETVRLQLIKSE